MGGVLEDVIEERMGSDTGLTGDSPLPAVFMG